MVISLGNQTALLADPGHDFDYPVEVFLGVGGGV